MSPLSGRRRSPDTEPVLPKTGRGRRIGLLGGSFNPAHEGHLHITRQALDHLALDEVWWLVSPQNPLKPPEGMAPFEERLASARRVAAGDRHIVVSDLEWRLGTRYAIDTLTFLRRRLPDVRFVWIMGADNMVEVPRWRDWRRIFDTVAIAVFARPSYSLKALSSRAARRFARARVRQSRAPDLADMTPPVWVFVHGPLHGASATRIRAQRGPGEGDGARRETERKESRPYPDKPRRHRRRKNF